MARLPAALTVVTPAGRSILLVAVVSYLVDTFGGWPVFQLIWVSCLMMLLVAVVLAVLPVRAVVELGVSPRRTVAGEGARVLVEATSASRLPVPGPLLDVPVDGREHLLRLPLLRPGHAVRRGIELEGSFDLTKTLAARLGVGVVRGEILDDGTTPSDIPADRLTFSLVQTLRRWWWRATAAAVAKKDDVGPTEIATPSYRTLDASVGVKVFRELEVRLHGWNLTDDWHGAIPDGKGEPHYSEADWTLTLPLPPLNPP